MSCRRAEAELWRPVRGFVSWKSTGSETGKSVFYSNVVIGRLSEICFSYSETWEAVTITLQGYYQDEMRWCTWKCLLNRNDKHQFLRIFLWLLLRIVFLMCGSHTMYIRITWGIYQKYRGFSSGFINFHPHFLVTNTILTAALQCSGKQCAGWGRTASFQILVLLWQFFLTSLCLSCLFCKMGMVKHFFYEILERLVI